jgi:hypothetical protein
MPEPMRESVDLPWIGGWRGGDGPACDGPELSPRAALERRGTVLDHTERSSPHRHAFLEVEHLR